MGAAQARRRIRLQLLASGLRRIKVPLGDGESGTRYARLHLQLHVCSRVCVSVTVCATSLCRAAWRLSAMSLCVCVSVCPSLCMHALIASYGSSSSSSSSYFPMPPPAAFAHAHMLCVPWYGRDWACGPRVRGGGLSSV